MSRYPVFIGGNVTSHDKYMVKLMTTSTAKHPNLDQTILTAPVTQPPRGLSKSKAQEKADRLAQRANATEDDAAAQLTDRWRISDPSGERNFSGTTEKAAENQDCFIVLVYDEQTRSFHAIKPTSLYLTPDAAKPRFTTLEEAELFAKRRVSTKASKKDADDGAEQTFDIRSMIRSHQGESAAELFDDKSGKSQKKAKAAAVREDWDWQRNDDDEGIENDNDVDVFDDDDVMFKDEKKKGKKTEEQWLMDERLRKDNKEVYGAEDEDDDDGLGRPASDDDEDDEEDDSNSNDAMTDDVAPARGLRASGSRALAAPDRLKRPRAADDADKAAKKLRRDVSTLTRADIVAVFAQDGQDPQTAALDGPELMRRLLGGHAKDYNDEQKRTVKELVHRVCVRETTGARLFRLQK